MRFAASLLALGLATAAPAAEYRLDPDRSQIRFAYTEDGVVQSGLFSDLKGEAEFDPDRPEATDVRLAIASDSIRLRDPIRTHFAQSADWFHAEAHPEFSFSLDRLERIGPETYRAIGEIRIKSRVVEIAVELVVAPQAGGLRAQGVLLLDRHEYGLGVGFSSLFVSVAREVRVEFDIYGRPSG